MPSFIAINAPSIEPFDKGQSIYSKAFLRIMSLLDGHSDWWWGKDEEFPIAQKCVVEIGYVRCLSVSVFLGFCVCEFVILYARGNVMAILSGHQKISKHFQVFFLLELDPGSLHCSLRCDEIQPIPLLVFP